MSLRANPRSLLVNEGHISSPLDLYDQLPANQVHNNGELSRTSKLEETFKRLCAHSMGLVSHLKHPQSLCLNVFNQNVLDWRRAKHSEKG